MPIKHHAIHWDVIGLFALLLFCDTAAQLCFKQSVAGLGEFPADSLQHVLSYAQLLIASPQLMLGVAALVIAFFTWIAIIARVDLSKAHPITCLSFGTVPLCAVWLLHEPITLKQALGVGLIVIGAYITSEHKRG